MRPLYSTAYNKIWASVGCLIVKIPTVSDPLASIRLIKHSLFAPPLRRYFIAEKAGGYPAENRLAGRNLATAMIAASKNPITPAPPDTGAQWDQFD